MKVRELIAALQKFDPEANVAIDDHANEFLDGLDRVGTATVESAYTNSTNPTESVVILEATTDCPWMFMSTPTPPWPK